MKRFFQILLLAVVLALVLCLLHNPAKGGFQHTKALSVDGRVLYLGSLNMTYRALKRNLEENVLVQDPKLAKEFDALFGTFAKESIPFDERYWDHLSKGERFRCSLAHRLDNLIIQ